jgi:thioredoxin 1
MGDLRRGYITRRAPAAVWHNHGGEPMAAETEYRDETRAPTREEIDGTTGPVLLEFGTPSCAFCRALSPKVAELLDRSPEVRHVKVGDGPGRALGRSFGVRLWPNLVFLRDGRVVRQLARPGHDQLEEAFRELVGRDASRGAL